MKHFDLQKKGVHPITGVPDTCIFGEPWNAEYGIRYFFPKGDQGKSLWQL